MFRDNGYRKFLPSEKTVNFIFMDGGLGDHLCSLVATDYAIKRYHWIRFLVWVPDYLLQFAKHVLPPGAIVGNYTSMARDYDFKKPTKTTKWDGFTSPMKIPLVDYAFLKLCDENPDIEHKNYLQINPKKINIKNFNLPNKYVVITSGYTAKSREFLAVEINKIIDYLKSKDLTPVFLGQKTTLTGAENIIKGSFEETINFGQGVNLIDQTSLLEAAKIMGQAQAVIGVDNGLLHLAACTDVLIVAGYTTVTPEARMPVRHNTVGWKYLSIVPEASLGCRFCQSNTNFLYGHDYRDCWYKDFECTKQISAEKFISTLRGII